MLSDLILKFGAKKKLPARAKGAVGFSDIKGNYTIVDVDTMVNMPTKGKKPNIIVGFVHQNKEYVVVLEMKKIAHPIFRFFLHRDSACDSWQSLSTWSIPICFWKLKSTTSIRLCVLSMTT